jgi:hypothetical protein
MSDLLPAVSVPNTMVHGNTGLPVHNECLTEMRVHIHLLSISYTKHIDLAITCKKLTLFINPYEITNYEHRDTILYKTYISNSCDTLWL